VENKVGYSRRNFFVPVPTITSFEKFNQELWKKCEEDGNRPHYMKKSLINDLWADDTAELLELPAYPFQVFRYAALAVNKNGFAIKSSTTEALRKFYERNSYALLKNDQTYENLIDLADFWNDVQNQSIDRFSDRILRKLFVLNYAPNSMWTYFVSVYYMTNRADNGLLEDEAFYQFLNRTIAFVWAYAVTNPGVNALRTPLFAEMINIVEGKPVTFGDFLFHTQQLQNAFQNYVFSNNRAITKSMLTWWAYQNPAQELLSPEVILEIEHIYARNRQEKEHSLSNPRNVESLGNKALLEKRINIRASDYRFADKKKYYVGFENARKQKKEGTKIRELRELADTATDFSEADIVQRHAKIIFGFVEFMNANQLLRND